MLVLITGATGFVGSHLVDHLLAETDWHLASVSRSLRHVEYAPPSARLRFYAADLTEPSTIEQVIGDLKPDGIIHLAGQPLEPAAWRDPAATFRLNVIGQINLFEAAIKAGLRPRTVLGGSALIYGIVKPEENPIDEDQPPRPTSPYSVSKLAADYLGYQYWVSHQLPVVRLRPFNQIGPRQSPDFVVSDFAKQIAEIERGAAQPVLRVGNLAAQRDFLDVRDAASAYRLALQDGAPGEAYNIGSGEAHSVQELLDIMLGMTSVPIRVEVDQAKFRPIDLPRIVCNAGKFRSKTGWQPRLPLQTSLRDTLDYWRQKTARS